MPERRSLIQKLFSKEGLYTAAPLVIATGFALAAHSGFLCSGGDTPQIQITAKAEPGTALDVRANGKRLRLHKKRGAKRVGDVNPVALGSKIYRATDTHWVPRAVVRKVLADPSLFALFGDFEPVRECSDVIGYRLVDIMPNGLFRKLGFKNGDLLISVDGKSIGSMQQIAAVVDGIEDADRVTVTVLRRGKTLQKTFLIE